MLKPLGLSHSNRNMVNVAACMATTPTSIQDAVSKGSAIENHQTSVNHKTYQCHNVKFNIQHFLTFN